MKSVGIFPRFTYNANSCQSAEGIILKDTKPTSLEEWI
jgi:hypothetical protein